METALGVMALVVALGSIYLAAHRGAQATEASFTGYFRGWRPDPWPSGVQEEDLAAPWGWDAPLAWLRERGRSVIVAVAESGAWLEEIPASGQKVASMAVRPAGVAHLQRRG